MSPHKDILVYCELVAVRDFLKGDQNNGALVWQVSYFRSEAPFLSVGINFMYLHIVMDVLNDYV